VQVVATAAAPRSDAGPSPHKARRVQLFGVTAVASTARVGAGAAGWVFSELALPKKISIRLDGRSTFWPFLSGRRFPHS